MMFIKLSIGCFLLRLAVQRRYTYTIYVSMAVVLGWSLGLWFWDIFQCKPVQAQWDYTIPHLQCVSAQQVVNAAYALSVMTIVTDWLFALMPIPMVWQVKMSVQAKMTVVVILGLGIFASIATIIRMKFLADLTDTSDILYAATPAMVWTLVEPGVAIVASSLVTIRPLLRRIRLKGFETTKQSHGMPYSGRSRSFTGGQGSRANKPASWKRRYSEMPGHGPNDVGLEDLEKAYRGPKGCSSRETMVTSSSRSSIVRGKTAWGGAGVMLRECDEEEDEDAISPVRRDGARRETWTHKSVMFVIEGPTGAHQGAQTWGDETPKSPEESEHIQGLTHPSRLDAGSRMSSRCSIP
ncbi:hypothetical protein VM1G_07123 [Cytospora mali]|uniref:Rhodopsin domain-containing protein n=1 Tax=Cytospora mali TaxID=578113 RepID=A0A194W3Y2_CYTMA|nr:hypothetical protein VM1G_07123 [Valsa mali]